MSTSLVPRSAQAAAPVAAAGPDRLLPKTHPLGREVALDGTGSSDADGDPLTYHWYGPFLPTAGRTPVVFIPEGQYTVSLLVDDGTTTSTPDTATIEVRPCFALTAVASPGKVLLAWPPQRGARRYTIYRAHEAPPSTFQPLADTPSPLPAYVDTTVANQTTYLYAVGISGPGPRCASAVVSARPPVRLAQLLANAAPVIYSEPIGQGTRTLAYTYDVNATDPNQDPLRYRLVTAPAGMTIAPTTGRIIWVPTTLGVVTVTVDVRDGRGGVATQSFALTVADRIIPNTPPVANAGPDQTVLVGTTVQLDGSGSTDVDGDALGYQWAFVSRPVGSGAVLSDPHVVTPTFTVDVPGTYAVQLIVHDGTEASAPDTVSVTTQNSPPVAQAVPTRPCLSARW